MYGLKLLVTEDSLVVRKESMPWKQTILKILRKKKKSDFLVAQWIRICLPKKGTALWSVVLEDSTCHGAARPTWHNSWARVPQLLKPVCYSTHEPQPPSLCAATTEACVPKSPHSVATDPTCCSYCSLGASSLCSETREATAIRSLHTATKGSQG